MGVAVKVTWVVVVAMMCILVASPTGVEGLTCGDVTNNLMPCFGYLRGAPKLDPSCCAGVKKLNSAAKTTNDRRTACKCLVSASKSFTGINYGVVAGLPAKCGVSIPYKISPSTDCSKYIYLFPFNFSLFFSSTFHVLLTLGACLLLDAE